MSRGCLLSAYVACVQIFREETFGPAVPLFKFGSEEEAIQLANDTEYGLAAYFFTKARTAILQIVRCCLYKSYFDVHDLPFTHQAASGLTSVLALNDGLITDPVAPFGGMKQVRPQL